jgi:hypothetical protein
MSKSVSGITKRNKRSIQEIKRKRKEPSESGSGYDESDKDSYQSGPEHQPPGRHNSHRAATFGLWFVGVVSILFVFFLFSVLFSETTVTVYPETADISIDQTYTAANDNSEESMPFSVVTATDSLEVNATTTGTEYREEVASGDLTVYNDHTTESIQLVANTRFQTSNGLIYRARDAVIVPGQSSAGNPGTVTVTVYADEPGREYNVSSARFSIPGFTGTEFESGVYAQSSGSISGGIADEVPIVSTSTQQALETEVGDQLENQLVSAAMQDIPDGFILYDEALFFTSSLGTSNATTSEETSLTVEGELNAIVFDARQLSTYLATNYSDDISSQSDIRIQNLEDFEFSISDRDSFTPSEGASFEFSLKGDSQIVWQYDERALVRDLRGLQKDRLNEVLVNYESIQRAEVVTRPFWKQNLPDDAAEIGIQTAITP